MQDNLTVGYVIAIYIPITIIVHHTVGYVVAIMILQYIIHTNYSLFFGGYYNTHWCYTLMMIIYYYYFIYLYLLI